MKLYTLRIALLFGMVLSLAAHPPLTSSNEEAECDTKTLKKEGISKLNPYYYSSSKVNTINYDYKSQIKEIEVPLFKGEKYKLVFNKSALPKDVVVKIYDKDKEHTGRDPLFSTEGMNDQIVSYEPKKAKTLYVDYLIPEAKGTKESGCIVFILGYQLTFVSGKEDNSEE
jgi:hypothetical protein